MVFVLCYCTQLNANARIFLLWLPDAGRRIFKQ
jgi:hypothetical protein